jgi:CRP-like cAMP-binding protein
VQPHLAARQLAGKELLFRAGDRHPYVYFVGSGLLKMVYVTEDGQEWVKAFTAPGGFLASLSALQPGGEASFSVCAVTPSYVERIDYAALRALAAQEPAWQRAMTAAFEIYGARKERRERELLLLSPAERYLQFLREHADIASVVSQKELAAYIRVTEVGLSRIKARLRREGAVGNAPPAR